MIGRSLSTRLLIALVAAQVGAIMLAMLIFPLLAPFVSYSDIADATFRQTVLEAIEARPDGELAVGQSSALEAYLRKRPGSVFAVMSLADDRILPGSDGELAASLVRLRPLAPRPYGNLVTDFRSGQTSQILTTEDTRFGRLLFATAGNAFFFEDWPSLMRIFLPALLPSYGPVMLGALVLIPLVVRMVTRPLRRLAAEADLVSHSSLQLRLDERGLGVELYALARAINEALARIEEGAARQRLYAANAAHELRTPIAILNLHVDELPASNIKTRLQLDVARVQTLVEQLVTVARLGQNHVAMDEQIDLAQLLRDVVADRAPIAYRAGREIELNSVPGSLPFLGNRQALFSALANVIDNAIRAEPSGGIVIVRAARNGIVEIIDHGAGVAPEDRGKVFEPFWRGSVIAPGAGLGLAIVKEIAGRHGVMVEFAETPGGGATFRFRFEPAGPSRISQTATFPNLDPAAAPSAL
jgi:two-component system OmpR family sensor kinase